MSEERASLEHYAHRAREAEARVAKLERVAEAARRFMFKVDEAKEYSFQYDGEEDLVEALAAVEDAG